MKARDTDVLIGYAKVAGLSRDAFQRCSGIPKRTFERRMANPDDITLGELRSMLKAIRIMPDEKVIEFIKGGKKNGLGR